MSRRLSILAGLVLILGVCTSLRSQDSPPLGDVARQLRNNKANSPAAKVVTNDDIAPSKDLGSDGTGTQVLGKPGSSEAAQSEIGKMEAKMNELDSVDRTTLVKIALQGQAPDFPGRSAWEDKLWDAKQTYVRQGRDLIERSRQLLATAQSLRDSQGGQKLKPDDPKLRDLMAESKQLVQDGKRAESDFLAVVAEGAELARQNAPKSTAASNP